MAICRVSLILRRCGVQPSTPHSSGFRGPPQGRDFAKLNLHLPACRSLGAGRALFEQPGKDGFFSCLLIILSPSRMVRVSNGVNLSIGEAAWGGLGCDYFSDPGQRRGSQRLFMSVERLSFSLSFPFSPTM